MQRIHAEGDQFRDAQPGGIKHVEHGVIAQTQRSLVVGLCQQAFDLFQAQIARQRSANLRRLQVLARISADQFLKLGEAEKIAQGYQVPRDGTAFQLLAIQAGQEFHKIVAGHRFQGDFPLFRKVVEFQQVAAISRHRVGRQSLFHANVREKGGDGGGDVHQRVGNPSAGSRRIAMP